MYGNDHEIKKAIEKAGIDRSKLYITSKVGPDQHGYQKAKDVVNGILGRLSCGYLDLILIHWPATYSLQESDKKNQDVRLETWKAFIELQK